MLKRNSYILIPLLVILALVLGACATAGADVNVGMEDLAGTRWVLRSYGDLGMETPVVEGSTVTLEIGEDGTIGGSAGCNSYGGDVQLDAGVISAGEITSTLMACLDETVMEQEEQYLAALRSASGVQLSGDELTILYNEGQSALHFMAAAAVDETGE